MRVVGIVVPFALLVAGTRGKFVFSISRKKIGTGDLCWVTHAAVCYGTARHISGSESCGNCRRVLWVPDPWGQYWGKIVLSRTLGYKTREVAIWLNVFVSPGLPTPKSNFRYGTQCEL